MSSVSSYNTSWQNLAIASGPSSPPISGSAATPTVITHDFGVGPYTRNISLDANTMVYGTYQPLNGWYPGGKLYNGSFITAGNYYPNPSQNSLQKGLVPGGHSVLLDRKGLGNPTDFDVNFVNTHIADGLKATRTLYINDDPFDGNTLVGPYTLTYSAEGSYTPAFVLYTYKITSATQQSYLGPQSAEYTGNLSTGPNSARYFDAKRFYINLRQKNVSIIRKDSSTGTVMPNGQNVTGMDTISNNVIVLDKSTSRKAATATSYWEIKIQSGTGSYVTATPGVEYTLGGGESLATSNLIHVTWLVAGNFRISLITDDGAYQPQGRSEVNFSVAGATQNTITFPDVFTSIVESGVFTNVVTSQSPLIGYANLEITASATLDTTNASWYQQIDANPVSTFILSDSEWKEEMESRLTIRCYVKQSGTVHQLADGFGPHTFIIPQGTYEVGFLVAPKVVTAIDINDFAASVL